VEDGQARSDVRTQKGGSPPSLHAEAEDDG